jgi:periplasmic protein TonB
VAIADHKGARLMVRVARRSYTRQSRTGRFLLLSLMLHLLAVVALNIPLIPWEEWRPEQKEQTRDPIRVSFVRPENTEEPEKPEVFAETSSRAQTPEGPKAEVAKSTEIALPKEQHAPAEPSPPSTPQVREEARPQAAQPPAEVTPEPEAPAKRPAAQPRRQGTAKATAPKPERPVKERPEPKRVAKAPEPAERKTTRPPPAEPPEPKRLARLPEPAERAPRPSPQEPAPSTRPAPESLFQPGQTALPRIGRIPLLSGEDLEKYAQVRSSGQHSSSGEAVSLDTKELKYLSYFAHIKRRIERVWRYPPDAVANGSQGQLHLKFVLRRNGQLKNVELLRSSGVKALDKEAWDAVVNAGPFESFPQTIPDDELHITARFTYVLDEAVQRIRMR